MKKLLEKIELEKVLTAVSGIIAAIAIYYEMKIAGFEEASVAGGIKDLAGIIIDVILLIVALNIFKRKGPEDSFENKMKKALEEWTEKHSNMIVKTSKLPKEHENDFGLSMTTNINRFYNTEKLLSDTGTGVGRFCRITEIKKDLYANNNVSMTFFFNSQTYCAGSDETELFGELSSVAKNVAGYIKGAVDGISVSEPAKSDAKTVVVTIRFTNSIIDENGEHIDKVINVLDRMYEAMLVSARRKS